MYNMFLSHISDEADVAKVLKDWIESTFSGHVRVFVSSTSIDVLPGLKWLEQIDAALESSKILLVLSSPQSIGRPWVNFETGCAWSKKVPIIPICHLGQKKNNLPEPFSQFQALELDDPDFSKELIKCVAGYFKISNLPRISHEHMMKELLDAEAAILKASSARGASGQSDQTPISTPGLATQVPAEEEPTELPLSFRVIFTTSLTSDNDPENNITSVSLGQGKFCIYIKWFYLKLGKEYRLIWRLHDAGGEVVTGNEHLLHPTTPSWNSWDWYSFTKSIDRPGTWTFVGFIDGQKIIEKPIEVTP